VGPLTDFVSTHTWQNAETKRKVFAIDCEMVRVTKLSEEGKRKRTNNEYIL